MEDCKLSPAPAGRREGRLRRPEPARHGVRRRPTATTTSSAARASTRRPRMRRPTRPWSRPPPKTGRDVGNYVLMMVIADETDEAAMAKWQHYNEGADMDAHVLAGRPGQCRPQCRGDQHGRQMAAPTGAVNFNMGTLVGSYATVARMLDECATVPATKGIMLDLRRLPDRHGTVRPAHPAADEEAGAAKLAAVALYELPHPAEPREARRLEGSLQRGRPRSPSCRRRTPAACSSDEASDRATPARSAGSRTTPPSSARRRSS